MLSRDPKAVSDALRLYWVFGPPQDGDWSALEQRLHDAVLGGVTMVQWRDKLGACDIEQVRRLREASSVPFLVNDDIELAKAICADGVHLGQDDMHPADARALLGPQAIIGLSVGVPDEVDRYDPSLVDYVGTGPLFPTQTKGDAGEALGLEGLNELVQAHELYPVVAIGGINSVKLAELQGRAFDTRVQGVAVVSAISGALDAFHAAQKLRSDLILLSSNSK